MYGLKQFAVVLLLVLGSPLLGLGQNAGGPFGGFGGGTGAGGNGGNDQTSAGIRIDSRGVVNLIKLVDVSAPLDKKRRRAIAQKSLSKDIHRRSKQRCVSLVQLERAVAQDLSEGKSIAVDQFYLAGLQRIDHVFIDPLENDLVVSGPADEFVADAVGRMIGVESGRPVLRLDDLVVALRAVRRSEILGCSIDPDPTRLAELRKFIRPTEPASVEEVEERFKQMSNILGLQNVRIDGVPPDSHFATILVEVDCRMKRIAAGIETPGVNGLKSHLATMSAKGQPMQRWWFVPSYESIYRLEDGQAFQFVGQRASLLTEEEIVDVNGNRTSSPITRKSNQAFAKSFSEKFSMLADRNPIFGELQNLIDWAVFAALLNQDGIAKQINWKLDLFLDEARLKHPAFDVPQKVSSQVSYKRAGNSIVGLVSGGVVIKSGQTFEQAVTFPKDSSEIKKAREIAYGAVRDKTHPWWWDTD